MSITRLRSSSHDLYSNVLFFERLPYELRILIYSYLDFFPFPNHHNSSGIAASCRRTREEAAEETSRQLWVYLQKLKETAAQMSSVFRLAKSMDTKSAMLGLRTLIILIDDIDKFSSFGGLLALNLDRLEVRLLKTPFKKTQRRFGRAMLRAVLPSLYKAAGPSCEINTIELAVV